MSSHDEDRAVPQPDAVEQERAAAPDEEETSGDAEHIADRAEQANPADVAEQLRSEPLDEDYRPSDG
ncbi:hypothetical protein C1701_04575 [Actinoalloteichus sp. AHMU CJ021]|uniref:DUF5709 domain-containing protein n=1 Tax=Actinoalloteichus caeruleus DSM 43889 TaxID=1120930 RepID=A0ABT1JHR1_ACTCY|nr:hypothetical protein [Actinoalloteichus caeruleus]AUS77757.1 hypothetical protein C1701_04575 [Actinoalloteichus sp. AHMU CJ021]MCP2331696.1 hypothetical protein [Actinoalloteichus caeruleus DSM 43889]